MPSLISLGFSFIILGSASSNPKAIAGNESFIKLINNNCNAVNGFGQLTKTAKSIAIIAPKFPANKYVIAFFILL